MLLMQLDHGFLITDKPKGISSRRLVNQVSRQTSLKVGHTGTLDPLASGMMVLSIGDATRFSQYIVSKDKAYRAVIKLGEATDTDDAEGSVIQQSSVKVSQDAFEKVLAKFSGEIDQYPPKHSAIHIDGKRAYKLARQAIEFDMPIRQVNVHEIKLESFDEKKQEATIYTHVSSGTYIRSLARDIGEALGSHGHLTELQRLWVSPFQDHLDTFISLSDYFKHHHHFETLKLDHSQAQDIINGKKIEVENLHNEPIAIFYQNEFLGLIQKSPDTSFASIIKLRSNPHAWINP